MDAQQVEHALRKTLEDGAFSRSERRELRTWIEEQGLEDNDLAFVRHQAFELARTFDDKHAAIDWLEGVNKALVLRAPASQATSSEVYFSPGEECLRAILAELRNLQEGADICVFTITDNRIRDELIGVSKRGIKLRVISDDDKSEDRGSDIDRLSDESIEVRLDRTEHHMHHKYALFDNKRLLTGSYNWTRSAAAFNQENLLITNSTSVIKDYRRHFNQLWQALANVMFSGLEILVFVALAFLFITGRNDRAALAERLEQAESELKSLRGFVQRQQALRRSFDDVIALLKAHKLPSQIRLRGGKTQSGFVRGVQEGQLALQDPPTPYDDESTPPRVQLIPLNNIGAYLDTAGYWQPMPQAPPPPADSEE